MPTSRATTGTSTHKPQSCPLRGMLSGGHLLPSAEIDSLKTRRFSFAWLALCAAQARSALVTAWMLAWLAALAGSEARGQAAIPPVGTAATVDTVVVCPAVFRQALEPWVRLRAEQGHGLVFVAPGGSADDIQSRIRQVAKEYRALRYVLLVGDAEPGLAHDAALAARCVPTFHTPAKVIRALGEDRDIAGDNRYGDLDGDGVPDLAVGRFPVDTPRQLSVVVQKIIAHEQEAFSGPARRRIHFVAGLGGFGRLADKVLEMCAQRFISEGVPAEYVTSMTYASWASPYCPPLEMFSATTVGRLNEGGLFWVYIGHGHPRGLDWIRLPNQRYQSILTCDDVSRLACQQGAPVALFLACYTGAFDRDEDCLAEELLNSQGGPVSVFSGSRTTMPYAMTVLGRELLKECFENRRATIGEIMLHAKRGMVLGRRDGPTATLLDTLATTLGFHDDLDAERREHLELFNLLGDPLLRVPHPQQMDLIVPERVAPGGMLEITGTCPIDGPCTIELVVPRDRLTFEPPRKEPPTGSPTQRENYQSIYQKANDRRLVVVQTECRNGRFQAVVPLPDGFSGKCFVVGYLQGHREAGLGARPLEVVHMPTMGQTAAD